jgi:hypothetical protein
MAKVYELPDASEGWVDDLSDAVVSVLQEVGYFDNVMQHEPKHAPGHGITAACWVQDLRALPGYSGLNKTSSLMTYQIRMYKAIDKQGPFIREDIIDVNMSKAGAAIIRTVHSPFDFDMDPLVSHVDVMGQHSGAPIALTMGHLEIDGTIFRAGDIFVPIVLRDMWLQSRSDS